MKLTITLVLLIVCSLAANAAVTPVASVTCNSGGATLGCTTATALAMPTGTTVVVFLYNATNPRQSYNVTDSCNNQYTPILQGPGFNYLDVWGVLTPVGPSCTITVTRASGTAALDVIAQSYTGVGSFGATPSRGTSVTTAANTLSAPCSGSIVTTAPNSYVETGYYTNVGTGQSLTTNVTLGTATSSFITAGFTVQLVHTQGTTSGNQLTNSITNQATVGFGCYPLSVELLQPGVGGRAALASDQMQTVLLQTPGAANYTLPNAQLGSQWCTFLMPTGAGSYNIAPQSPAQLNGGNTNMSIPAWWASRICQASDGNYWANPPLIGGTGITISSTPTAVTIATSSMRVTAVGNGLVSLGNGTTSVPSGGCVALAITTQTGVQPTDNVTYTFQGLPAGWANGSLNVVPEPSANTITWQVCNSSTVAIVPTAATLNWLAMRVQP